MAVITLTPGNTRLHKHVQVDGVYKGFVYSFLGTFGAVDAQGNRITDGENMLFTLRREAIAAVAGS